MANEDKKRALDAAIAKLEKDFGKGTVMRLGDPAAQVAVENDSDRIIKPGPCTGARRSSKGAYRRDLRTRVKW